ncbi:hypothetical protein E2P64_07875 [Candidatus Bathyarchaeota archaeon]|nr:hypothetical protein E2P64_07875 [Candidatus Bathyarchaeota archaeon]
MTLRQIALIALTILCGCTIDVESQEHLNHPLPDGCREAPELECGRGFSVMCEDGLSPGPEIICDRVWIRSNGEIGYCCDDGTEI